MLKWQDYAIFFLIAYLPILFLMSERNVFVLFTLPVLPALLFSALLGTVTNLIRAIYYRKNKDET